MQTIKNCLLINAVTVSESESVIEVAKKMHKFQERRIFVLNSKKYPIGIISLVDMNDRVVAQGVDLKKTKAKDVMSYPIKIVFEVTTPIEEAKTKMILNDNYYCPVVEKGVLKGIINYSSILEALKNGN